MELQASFEEIIKKLKSDLENDNDALREEIKKVSKAWEEKMHTNVKLSTDNKVYQASVAIKEAKRQINEISEVLKTIDKSSTTYTILNEKLNYLNEVVRTYQESFDDMEKDKNEIKLKNDNKKAIISNSISELIKALELKEEEITKEISTLKENILNCSNEEFEELSDRVKESIGSLNKIKDFKVVLNDLYSKNIKSFDESKLNNLDKEYKEIASIYYSLINKYNISMDKKVVNPPEKNYDLEEILYYLDIAQNSKLDETKRKQALDIAYELTNKLEDSELKEDLYADLATAYDALNKRDDNNPDYEYAKSLVEKAEKTEKSEDFINALDSLEKLEESKRDELAIRLNALREKAEDKFVKLLEEIKVEIVKNDTLDKEKFLELEDKYKYISSELAKQYKADFENIIIFNNNLKQDEVKENYEKKKDGFFTKVGKIVTFVKGSKIATKFNLGRLSKIKSIVADTEDEDKKQYFEEKYLEISNKLTSGSIVGGLRLFVAQQKLENMKTKLYSGEELSSRKAKIYNKAIQIIDKQMNKGLNSKSNLTIEVQDKKYVTSIIDQYLYLIATGNDYDSSIKKLEEYLEKVSKCLTNAEDNAIREQIYIIKDYRDATAGAIYEIKTNIEEDTVTTELDDVVRYYDSEEFNKGFRNTPIYIKR